ncbi:hypothetical protein JAAARDRAFT_311510 [Jaapia argillacea MUCL 33604]|uniref:F-box domain-containing protein n=1 Tax=Jaapia argillacea MUCL 33604 TaxID=933084 RepID=A0A067PNN1_9AGAM|nr:hypothetical protein JAAARDRAFT_311510 [Jaapia argillacea MUCL 33604]
MSIHDFPVELHQAILAHLPLPDLLSAHHVNGVWRSLVPRSTTPHRLFLFNLAFLPHECDPYPHPVTLTTRLTYVEYIESTYSVRIPEEYRIVLTEWPISIPPAGIHWPHGLRFFDDPVKGCTCSRRQFENLQCGCKRRECYADSIFIVTTLLDRIHAGEDFDFEADVESRCELFDKPPLDAPETRMQTLRLLNSYRDFVVVPDNHDYTTASAVTLGIWKRAKWSKLSLLVLDMSAYPITIVDPDSDTEETRVHISRSHLILTGAAKGQIHGWSMSTWYDGFHAENFFEWRVEELKEEQLQALRGGE